MVLIVLIIPIVHTCFGHTLNAMHLRTCRCTAYLVALITTCTRKRKKERERERQGKRARERERIRLRGSDQELSTTDGSIHCPHINNTDVSPKTHMILPSQNPTVPAATRIAEERRRQIDEERDRKRNKPQGSGNYQGKHLNHMSCVFRKAINFTLNMHDIHGIEVRWQDQLNPDGRGCSAPNITLSG